MSTGIRHPSRGNRAVKAHVRGLFLLAVALTLLFSSASATPYHSAKCLVLGRFCPKFYAQRSGLCSSATPAYSQSAACVRQACRWCEFDARKAASTLCRNPTLLNRCKHGRPAMKPSPSPQAPLVKGSTQAQRRAGMCTWTGSGGRVVINLGDVVPPRGWYRTWRDGFAGMVFRPYWGHGLARPWEGGRMCFPVRAGADGDYFFTFVSYGPHPTEHNDAWVRASLPIKLVKTDGKQAVTMRPNVFLKAYQSNGKNGGMSVEMKTVDSAGHRFIIPNVKKGRRFTVCLAGRSFKFSVFRLVLQKCFGNLCEGGNLWRRYVYKMHVSPCRRN